MSKVLILRDPADTVAQAAPVSWAISQLCETLAAKGVDCAEQAATGTATGPRVVLAATPASALAQAVLRGAGLSLPAAPEALAIVPDKARTLGHRSALLACGSDVRGLVSAVLELADRVACGASPLAGLSAARPAARPAVEQPANPVRGIMRMFASEIEDKPWFYDHSFWQKYLTMLAGQRFNRFQLALGLGYDFVRNVTDAYFLFPYPFFVDVPGYSVCVAGLPDEERDRNLETLRFIAAEARQRGLHFQLGLWMHAYEWVDSPNANYTIAGLTPQSHAAYCRDALHRLLDQCPGIDGITFRVHGESGVPEGSYDFWRTVFDGIVQSGQKIELNLHPKGINQDMIDIALATGLPVTISPKYTAEHMGLPYHHASIRELERVSRHPEGDAFVSGLMNMSGGSLRYTRYGYADFLKRDRGYGVFSRMWPGTQRLLLWGDPALAAGLGRSGSFCGCLGVDLMEPLSFKGRLGSGLPGGREAYADASLRPAYDFEKYLYTYRLLGRLLYNPHADAQQWRRYLRHEFGPAAPAVERALASSSRILPLVTTAHLPSAHYGCYWPEMYTNMPIVDAKLPHPYRDTDEPRLFGNVSSLDPAIFSKIDEFADEVAKGASSGRYSPLRVASWLDKLASQSAGALAKARKLVAEPRRPEFRRLAIDVTIESDLGRFFANKLRAGVGYALFVRTGELGRLSQAVAAYRAAEAAWEHIVEVTSVYQPDITAGVNPNVRGHWADRMAVLQWDMGIMQSKLHQAESSASPQERAEADRLAPLADLDPEPPAVDCSHTPPAAFTPGQPVEITFAADPVVAVALDLHVRLHYRRVNQAESYQVVAMERSEASWQAVIPAGYTGSPYALEYFFELRTRPGQAWLYPGFEATLNNQPYFVLDQR